MLCYFVSFFFITLFVLGEAVYLVVSSRRNIAIFNNFFSLWQDLPFLFVVVGGTLEYIPFV
jgi:hypothetical protein